MLLRCVFQYCLYSRSFVVLHYASSHHQKLKPKNIPVLPVAVWQKSRDGAKNIRIYYVNWFTKNRTGRHRQLLHSAKSA